MRRIALAFVALLALFGAIGPAAPSIAGKSVNQHVNPQRHGLGLIRPSMAQARAEIAAARFSPENAIVRGIVGQTSLPDSVSLSQWDPGIGDQGYIGSCVSWAEGWYYEQWLLKHDWGQSFPAGGPAPIMVYVQQTHDPNAGSTFEGNFASLEQGIATDAQYDSDHSVIAGHNPYNDPGYYNYLDNPTAADRISGAQYAISGYTPLFINGVGSQDQGATIKAELASGKPVVIGIAVYSEFYWYSGNGYIQPHATGSTFYGNHAIFVDGYDANGISGPNQWGKNWGSAGRFHLSWAFVNSSDLFAAYTAYASLPPTPTPTVVPTATATANPTATPRPANTSTAVPTSTPVTPTATVTSTPVPHKHHRYIARPRWLMWPE
jgi:cell division septation protein DedD